MLKKTVLSIICLLSCGLLSLCVSACGNTTIDQMLGNGININITPNSGANQGNSSFSEDIKQSESSNENTTEIESSSENTTSISSEIRESSSETEHSHEWNFAYTREPMCESEGETAYTCWCGEFKSIPLPAINHEIRNYNGKDATCLESGWLPYEACNRCNYTTYQSISPLGHQWTTDICTVCGKNKEEIKQTHDKHIFTDPVDNNDGTHSNACLECEYVDIQEHEWSSYIYANEYNHDAECLCGATSKLAHSYQYSNNNDGSHDKYCSDCATTYAKERHIYASGVCSCGAIEPTGVQLLYDFNYENHTAVVKGIDGAIENFELAIPDTVYDSNMQSFEITAIADDSFADWSNNGYLTSVTIGKNVKSIGKNAFYGQQKLSSFSVVDGSQLEIINDYAFAFCPLTYIEFPDSIGHVGYSAFPHCNAAKIIFDGTAETWTETTSTWRYGWSSPNTITKVECIDGTIIGNGQLPIDHINAHRWENYRYNDADTHIMICSCGATGKVFSHNFTYDDNGDGTHSQHCHDCGWMIFEKRNESHELTYTDNGNGTHNKRCRYNCRFEYFNELHIFVNGKCVCGANNPNTNGPETVQPTWLEYKNNGNGTATITGRGSYVGNELIIPGFILANDGTSVLKVIAIENGAFMNTSFTSVIISESIESIGEGAFMNCDQLTAITLPKSLTYIGADAFINCSFWKNGITFTGSKLEWEKQKALWATDWYSGGCQVKCSDGIIYQ